MLLQTIYVIAAMHYYLADDEACIHVNHSICRPEWLQVLSVAQLGPSSTILPSCVSTFAYPVTSLTNKKRTAGRDAHVNNRQAFILGFAVSWL